MQQDELLILIQEALDPQNPNTRQAHEEISELMYQSNPELLEMCIFASTAENAPEEFKNQAALLVKNFLTSKNPQHLQQSILVYENLSQEFRNSSLSTLINQMKTAPFEQLSEVLSALISSSVIQQQREIIQEIINENIQASTFTVLQTFDELKQISLCEIIPNFCLECLQNFEELFLPEEMQSGIKLTVKVLRKSIDYISEQISQPLFHLLFLLLEQSVSSEQTEFIQEILEFFTDIIDKYNFLSIEADNEPFVTQLLNLSFMYSQPSLMIKQLLFTILELQKKIYDSQLYKSIYQSEYPFSTVESCIIPILNTTENYLDEKVDDIFVVVQELLHIIISESDQSFTESYLEYVRQLGLFSITAPKEQNLSADGQFSLLKYLILVSPILSGGRNLDTVFLQEMHSIALLVLENFQIANPQLLQQCFDMIAHLMPKTTNKIELFNATIELFPFIQKDFHWRALRMVLQNFKQQNQSYLEQHLSRVFEELIANKQCIDTSTAMVLIDLILPTLEQCVNITNYYFFMQKAYEAFQQVQEEFLAQFALEEIPYAEVITEALNLPVFFIISAELNLPREQYCLFDAIIDRVFDLLAFYLPRNAYEVENEMCELLEILTIVTNKRDYQQKHAQQIIAMAQSIIEQQPFTEVAPFCLDLLSKTAEFYPSEQFKASIIELIRSPYASLQLINSVLIFFIEDQKQEMSVIPEPLQAYVESFLEQAQAADFTDKYTFLILQSVVILLNDSVQYNNTFAEEAIFSAYTMISSSKMRPRVSEDPKEYLFQVGYENAINTIIIVYNKYKTENCIEKQQMVLQFVSEIGKSWVLIKERLREMGLEEALSQFQGQFCTVLK